MTSSPSRVPAGVPAGGQWAASARPESSIRLAVTEQPTCADLSLPDWSPPSDTSTPTGAFSRCKDTSAEYTSFLRTHGIDAEWVHVIGPRREFPDADARWKTVAQERWQHYLTRVTGPGGDEHYVDWTARQFDPNAMHPHITAVIDDQWAQTYPVDADTVDHYLSSWHTERAAQHRTASLPAGRLRIDDYFAGGVADYVKTPWVQVDLHITLVPEEWRHISVAEVPTGGVKRTQSRLIKARVAHHLDVNAEPDGGTVPWVVRYRGDYWVVDGHHRFAAAQMRGEKTLHGHLVDLDEGRWSSRR